MTALFGFWGGEIFPKRFSPFCPILCHLLPPLLHHNGGDERPPSSSPRSRPEVGYLRAKFFAGPTFFLRKSHPFPLYIVRRARRRRPKAVSSLWYPFREKRSLDGDGRGGDGLCPHDAAIKFGPRWPVQVSPKIRASKNDTF